MPVRTRRRDRESGIALLEVLTAAVILALALSTCLGIISTASRSVAHADAQLAAFRHAESLVARVGNDIDLHSSNLQGAIDELYRWRIEVLSESPDTSSYRHQATNFRYIEFLVVVSWSERDRQRQATLPCARIIELEGGI